MTKKEPHTFSNFPRERIIKLTAEQDRVIDALLNEQEEDKTPLIPEVLPETTNAPSDSDERAKKIEHAADIPQAPEEEITVFEPVHTETYGSFGKDRTIISIDLLTRASDIIQKLAYLINDEKTKTKHKESYTQFKEGIQKIFERLEILKNADFTAENEAEIARLKAKIVDAFNTFDAHYARVHQ